jgi:hypothetical protein
MSYSTFQLVYRGLVKKLKSEGRGDTKNNKEIPDKSLDHLFTFLGLLQRILEADKESEIYAELMTQLPKKFVDKYHYLIQWAMMFLIGIHGARRGREGIHAIEIDDFLKVTDDNGFQYWSKVKGRISKNHQTDTENLEIGGIIPFVTNEAGLNPGRFLELYIGSLSPYNIQLFQRPRRPAKKFSLHDPKTTTYYEKSKVGINVVGKMMPKLSVAVGVPRFTNNTIRPSAIRRLKRAGYEDR